MRKQLCTKQSKSEKDKKLESPCDRNLYRLPEHRQQFLFSPTACERKWLLEIGVIYMHGRDSRKVEINDIWVVEYSVVHF